MTLKVMGSLLVVMALLAAPTNATDKFDVLVGPQPNNRRPTPHLSSSQLETLWSRIRTRIFNNFEPNILTHGQVIRCEIVNDHSLPSIRVLDPANAEARFYCEQAIWDAGFFSEMHGNRQTITFSERLPGAGKYSCMDLYFSKHPALRGKVAVVHLIEPVTADYYKIPGDFFQSDWNLRAIPFAKLSSLRVDEFRKARATLLFNVDMSEEQLRDEATKLSNSFSDLFIVDGCAKTK